MSRCSVSVGTGINTDDLKDAIEGLGRAIVELGRLQAIQSFFESSLEARCTQVAIYAKSFECARRLFEFAKRHFLANEILVGWSKELLSDADLGNGGFSQNKIADAAISTESAIRTAIVALRSRIDLGLESRLAYLLEDVEAAVTASTIQRSDVVLPSWINISTVPARVFVAPLECELDPIFFKSGSLADGSFPLHEGAHNPVSLAKRFWLTAMHEGLASRLCLITVFEYDGLPFSFYDDLIKQAADEANHAVRFLRLATLMIEELKESSAYWQELADRLTTQEAALPVPIEGDFYVTIRTADLRTRFTWMQIDTEGPGVGALITLAQDTESLLRPNVQRALEYIIRDEITHARLGKRWIRALHDHPGLLDMDDARLLRGLLLAESVAASRKMNLAGYLALLP